MLTCTTINNQPTSILTLFNSFTCLCGEKLSCMSSYKYCFTIQTENEPFIFEAEPYSKIFYGIWSKHNEDYVSTMDDYDIMRLPFMTRTNYINNNLVNSTIVMVCSYECKYLKEAIRKLKKDYIDTIQPKNQAARELDSIKYYGTLKYYKYHDLNDYEITFYNKYCSNENCNALLANYRMCSDVKCGTISKSYKIPGSFSYTAIKIPDDDDKIFYKKLGLIMCYQCYIKRT